MTGFFRRRIRRRTNQEHEPIVEILISGPARSRTNSCLVDTGYNGYLLLPRSVATDLALVPTGTASLDLADGTQVQAERFFARVLWLTQWRLVRAATTNGPDTLIGAGLLFPHRLRIDYAARTVEIS